MAHAQFTDSQWEAIRAVLPRGVDETWFRGELEQIASDTLSPRKQEGIYLDRARLCADMIRNLPGMEHISDKDALSEQLKRQQQEDSKRARIYGRIAAQKQPKRFLQQCHVLWLWERAGGSLRITTPKRKPEDRRSSLPRADVILYFQAAARAIWGKAPGAHQIKDIVRGYRRTFKPASALIASNTKLRVDATSVKQASTRIASSTGVNAEGT